MILRYVAVLAAVGTLAIPGTALSQVIRGRTDPTTCPTPFRPMAGLTFHGGYAWRVEYHTFPYQIQYAHYSALPSPAISEDGSARWSNPGAYVECTLIWYHNPDGSVAFVDLRWHIISYSGTITENPDGGCGGDDGRDPIYMESYDPYGPDLEDETSGSVQEDCGGGGSDDGSGGGSGSCYSEWMEIEISYDGGATWQLWWAGWGRVCQQDS